MPSPLQAKLHEAIQKTLHEDPDPEWNMAGGLVAKWVIGVEVALPDGATILFHNCSPDTPGWQIQGMLGYLMEVERAKVYRDYREDPD